MNRGHWGTLRGDTCTEKEGCVGAKVGKGSYINSRVEEDIQQRKHNVQSRKYVL